jgi:hypothetical protein
MLHEVNKVAKSFPARVTFSLYYSQGKRFRFLGTLKRGRLTRQLQTHK